MLTKSDIEFINRRKISEEAIIEQLNRFKSGFPFLDIIAPATPDNGIRILSDEEMLEAERVGKAYKGEICKFVPASGAATRMFKDLFEAYELLKKGKQPGAASPAAIFFEKLKSFPFYNDLINVGVSEESTEKEVLELLLFEDGLEYGSLPKGLIKFHKYNSFERTSFEEHLIEGSKYALSEDGTVRLVMTVLSEHLTAFKQLFDEIKESYEKRCNCRFDITFTLQKSSTDTVASTPDNHLFRKQDGSLLFRPAGHGALIENLNEINSEIVIIKNIDNVSREELTDDTVKWKRIQMGVLLKTRDVISRYLDRLDNEWDPGLFEEITDFLKETLNISIPTVPDSILKDYLKAKLNRPLRICGMVKNEGEPGGGPYLVRDADGATSLQILESVQLNVNNPLIVDMVKSSTHFNPVDIICCFTDYRDRKFDLTKFTDPETGFISTKSYEGKPIKALELPGLWNGAMSQWNTIFIEVPLTTFTPVKTIFDLLRKEHL